MNVEKIICRYLSNDLSFNDKQKLEEWIHKAEPNKKVLDDYRKIWKIAAISEEEAGVTFDAQKGWDILQKRMTCTKQKKMENNSTQININDFPQGIRNFISDHN